MKLLLNCEMFAIVIYMFLYFAISDISINSPGDVDSDLENTDSEVLCEAGASSFQNEIEENSDTSGRDVAVESCSVEDHYNPTTTAVYVTAFSLFFMWPKLEAVKCEYLFGDQ